MMERENRIDLVRCTGIIAVLVIHCAGYVLNRGLSSVVPSYWITADVFNSLSRAGVPLFFMVSGALLLGKGSEEGVGTFFRKRLSRIAIPFLVWSVAYVLYNHTGAGRTLSPFDFVRVLSEPAHYHLWFLYSIFGLYLVTPLLRPLVKGADRWYVPVLWLLTIPMFFALETFTPVRFNPNFTRVLPVYVGFFVGGYLLRNMRVSRPQAFWCAAILLASWAVSTFGNYHLVKTGFAGYKGYFNDYLSISVVAMSVCGYLLLMSVNVKTGAPFIRHLSACSMGVYLLHPVILDLLNASFMPVKVNAMMLHPAIGIPATVVVVLGISLGAVTVIRKIPGVRMAV